MGSAAELSAKTPSPNFNLAAAKQALAEKPLRIDIAMREGIKDIPTPDAPGADEGKRKLFKFFEEEIFTEDNLMNFARATKNDRTGLSRNSINALHQKAARLNGSQDKPADLALLLDHIDLAIRQTVNEQYANPLAKIVRAKADQALDAFQAFYGLDEGVTYDRDKAIKECNEHIKSGMLNAISFFLGIVRIIPKILEKEKIQLSEDSFKQLICSIKNLVANYAKMNIFAFAMIRENAAYDRLSDLTAHLCNGIGTSRFPAKQYVNNPDKVPDLYYFHHDCFNIVNDSSGPQVVNTEKLLERVEELFKSKAPTDSKLAKMIATLKATPTLGCPLIRVQVDGENFISVVFDWLERIINNFYVNGCRNAGMLKAKK